MAKYILSAMVILVVLFALNFFNIVSIPFLDPPDFLTSKQDTVQKTEESVKEVD